MRYKLNDLCCPITGKVMREVVKADGHSFEKTALLELFETKEPINPVTQKPFNTKKYTNNEQRTAVTAEILANELQKDSDFFKRLNDKIYLVPRWKKEMEEALISGNIAFVENLMKTDPRLASIALNEANETAFILLLKRPNAALLNFFYTTPSDVLHFPLPAHEYTGLISLFFEAVSEADIQLTEVLIKILKKGEALEIATNARDQELNTLAHCVAMAGDTMLVSLFSQQDINLTWNTSNYENQLPLHIAAQRGHAAMVDYLLSQTASRHQIDNEGYSPIMYAANLYFKSQSKQENIKDTDDRLSEVKASLDKLTQADARSTYQQITLASAKRTVVDRPPSEAKNTRKSQNAALQLVEPPVIDFSDGLLADEVTQLQKNLCHLTQKVPINPVMAADEHIYEKTELLKLFAQNIGQKIKNTRTKTLIPSTHFVEHKETKTQVRMVLTNCPELFFHPSIEVYFPKSSKKALIQAVKEGETSQIDQLVRNDPRLCFCEFDTKKTTLIDKILAAKNPALLHYLNPKNSKIFQLLCNPLTDTQYMKLDQALASHISNDDAFAVSLMVFLVEHNIADDFLAKNHPIHKMALEKKWRCLDALFALPKPTAKKLINLPDSQGNTLLHIVAKHKALCQPPQHHSPLALEMTLSKRRTDSLFADDDQDMPEIETDIYTLLVNNRHLINWQAINAHQQNALHLAISQHNLDQVIFSLLDIAPDNIWQADSSYYLPITLAIKHDNLAIAKRIARLEQANRSNVIALGEGVDKKPIPCTEPKLATLVKACKQGNLDKARQLIAQGVPVNAYDTKGEHPLFAALKSGLPAVVGLILEKVGMDATCPNLEDCKTALPFISTRQFAQSFSHPLPTKPSATDLASIMQKLMPVIKSSRLIANLYPRDFNREFDYLIQQERLAQQKPDDDVDEDVVEGGLFNISQPLQQATDEKAQKKLNSIAHHLKKFFNKRTDYALRAVNLIEELDVKKQAWQAEQKVLIDTYRSQHATNYLTVVRDLPPPLELLSKPRKRGLKRTRSQDAINQPVAKKVSLRINDCLGFVASLSAPPRPTRKSVSLVSKRVKPFDNEHQRHQSTIRRGLSKH